MKYLQLLIILFTIRMMLNSQKKILNLIYLNSKSLKRKGLILLHFLFMLLLIMKVLTI